MVHTGHIELRTRGHTDPHDLTGRVEETVARSGIRSGTVTVFTPSSTSALTTIEYEEGALADLRQVLDDVAPPGREYRHHLRWGDHNGHAHLRAALLGPSLSIPVIGGRLTLGTWQQILFLDFDTGPRQRQVVVQVVGEADG